MQCALDARAVIGIECAHALDNVIEFGAGEFRVAQNDFIFNKARRGDSSEVEDDFEEQVAVIRLFHGVSDVGGEDV